MTTDDAKDGAEERTIAERRRLLQLAGLGAAAVVTIRPAIAQAATSVLNCQIPIPDPARTGTFIAADGSTVAPNTPGSFAPPVRPLTGEEVKAALGGRSLPGATSAEQNRAWINYIRRLQRGQSGFTCYASLQMPR
jgi:hypothetical protein